MGNRPSLETNETNQDESYDGSSLIAIKINLCFFDILDYCDENARNKCVFLSKYFYGFCTSESSFRWRLERLHVERGVHFPPLLPPNQTWKSLFLDLNRSRNIWLPPAPDAKKKRREDDPTGANNDDGGSSFRVSVCVRFKPKQSTDCHDSSKVSLPLHQRLALIRFANNLSSNREALLVLKEQGHWFHDQQQQEQEQPHHKFFHCGDNDGMVDGSVSPIKRDQDPAKQQQPDEDRHRVIHTGVHTVRPEANSVIIVEPNKGLGELRFDHVMGERCSQKSLYEGTTMRLVTDFINGTNVTCLVYGQTGSGKTHSMIGNSDSSTFKINEHAQIPSTHWGIIPRAGLQLCESLEYRRRHCRLLSHDTTITLSVSYVEIFGNDVYDLLREGAPCGHSRASAQRFVLDGSAEVPVANFGELARQLNLGEAYKRKAATSMNARSSRAHTLLIYTLRQKLGGTARTSHMFMADLGGSEQLKKSQRSLPTTKNEDPSSTMQHQQQAKERQVEAVNINMGLLALKQCVDYLKRRKPFIPYADSKLTMLLSPGLGQHNSKTTVIICASPDERHGAETLGALRFGQVCGKIKTAFGSLSPSSSLDWLQHLVTQLDKDIRACEERVRRKERWENKVVITVNEYGEEEFKRVTTLTGAEEDRRELDLLMRRRSELMGDSVTTTVLNTGHHRAPPQSSTERPVVSV